MNPRQRIFTFGDGEDHDATVSEISAELDNCFNSVWNIAPTESGVVGSPTYTVEVSDDGVSWFDYDILFVDVSTVDAVEDTQMSFLKIRVNHKAGTASAGTVKYIFEQKARS